MGTIQKRADELKPGDVLTNPSRDIVLSVVREGATLRIGTYDTEEQKTATRYLHTGDMADVESPDLTPAQQHAEELLALVKESRGAYQDEGWQKRAAAVMDACQPPDPPTLAEALALVENLAGGHTIDRVKLARELLDRARRAKLI